MKKSIFLKSAIALALAAPLLASAESQLTIGAGAAAARLDFRVVIPRVLFLAVGTGSAALATNINVDTVTFDYTANPADVGAGAAAVAGSITGNVVPVRALGNNGVIALASTNTGALTNVAGDTIPWSQITATSSDTTNFASPAPTGASVNLGVTAGKITNRTANWTFNYANAAVVAPGTYGTTNGRVTYTATMP